MGFEKQRLHSIKSETLEALMKNLHLFITQFLRVDETLREWLTLYKIPVQWMYRQNKQKHTNICVYDFC